MRSKQFSLYSVSATILVCGFDNNVNDSLDEIKVIQVGIKEADLGWTAWVGIPVLPLISHVTEGCCLTSPSLCFPNCVSGKMIMTVPIAYKGFPGSAVVKNPPAMQETQGQSLGQEDPLEKEMATHSSSLAREVFWTEEPGGLQSMGLQRVRHTIQ